MRYYSYNEFSNDENGEVIGKVVTISEDIIRGVYFPYWYDKMCIKFGKQIVDENYSFEECLDDWIVVYCAWESKDETTKAE
jgi:hypothetical protein